MPVALFCACNSWENHSRVGSHHLAEELARRGWKIAFVSDPISPLHLLKGITPELMARFKIYQSGGRWIRKGIWTWVPGALCTPHNKALLRTEFISKHWPALCAPKLRRALTRAGFSEFDLVYVDSLTQAYWWRTLPHNQSVFRLADNLAGFDNFTQAGEVALKDLAHNTNLLLYTSGHLKNLAESLAPRESLFFPNGVDYAHYSIPAPIPQEYSENGRLRIVYVGVMEQWFDFPLVEQAARQLEQYDFFLIGPQNRPFRHRLANIHSLGPRPFSELPSYLQHAHAGIIPFNPDAHPELVHSINPLKLYEYMAAGLPVVSRRWATLEALQSPAVLVDTAEEFTAALKTLPSTPHLPSREFAQRFTWASRADTLLHKFPPKSYNASFHLRENTIQLA